MIIGFEYFLNGETGTTTLTVLKGDLNTLQKEMLEKEILEQQTTLLNQSLENPNSPQHFQPRSPIQGLPENTSFEYTNLKASRRSVAFKFWKEIQTPLSKIPSYDMEDKTHSSDIHSKIKDHEIPKQQDWVLLFIEDLDQCLNALLPPSIDSAEKTAIKYAMEELQKSLTSNSQNSTLLLFSAYLQSTITHFLQVDKDKAHFFKLAARALETETDIKKTTPLSSCDESLHKNLFTKILQKFFLAKGS